ncbi:MAG: RnfABCDGE type electron transport complex subunit D [Spirochaetaceae bacterium]|nr:MAG: RnfABCDGE type electron transport complex subunit D [Spirochaetaceae bacterium]
MSDTIIVSSSPHAKTSGDVSKIMWVVCFSLLPTAVASAVIFGIQSLIVIGTSVLTCVITELVSQLVFKRKVTISDGSAVVTGILLAFTLPPTAPVWVVIIGAVVAIFLVKQLFGGLGYNIFNPALAARAFLLASFPVIMTTWIKPVSQFMSFDAVTSASFLNIIKEGATAAGQNAAAGTLPAGFSYLDMLFGIIPGSLGETCKITLLAGGFLLLLFRIIDFRVPLAYIATVALSSWIFGRDPIASVLSGGLILGAFFMATDMVTSPITKTGKVVFGIGCGLLVVVIRFIGGFPEGVCYSILLMNCMTPLIDKFTKPRVFGKKLFQAKQGANTVQKTS